MSQRIIYIFILIFALTKYSLSQDNVMYQFNKLPQAAKLNPAFQPDCNFFVGLPILSNFRFSYDNNAFNYKQLFYKDQDSIRINLDELSEKLSMNNHIRIGVETDLLHLGYRFKDYYFFFNYGHQSIAGVSFPSDVLQIFNGNWNTDANVPVNLDFSSLGANVNSYHNFSLSISKKLDKKLQAGIRFSYLKGLANISNTNRKLAVYTSAFPISLLALADAQINTAGLVITELSTDSASIPSISADNSQLNAMSLLFPKNNGLSLDLGIQYQYNDFLSIEASIKNIGYINWKVNPSNISLFGSYAFDGINFDEYLAGNTANTDIVQTLQDSVLESFNTKITQTGYRKALPLHFYFSTVYKLNEKAEISGVIHALLYDQVIEASATAGISYQFLKNLQTNLSISYLNSTFNMGGALIFGSKNAQFYILSENIPLSFAKISGTPILIPYSAKTVNLQFGLNLKFGCNAGKKGKSNNSSTNCPAYKQIRKSPTKHKKVSPKLKLFK
jgi:hypothetical protein